jgi:hypothetical protein
MGRKSHVQVLAFLMFALLLAPTSWGDDGQTSSAETERSNDGRCHRVKGGEGDEQQSGGGCSDGIPRISNMVEWEEHVRSSKFSVVGFFGDTASAEKGDFEAVFSQGKHRMAIVEQSPRSWLGTRALPDWLGIDCSHDSSTYAVATYHSDAQGRLPNRDVDALFGGSRARRGKMPKISFFIHTRSSPLLGIAASVEESLLEASGRCLIAIVHEVTIRAHTLCNSQTHQLERDGSSCPATASVTQTLSNEGRLPNRKRRCSNFLDFAGRGGSRIKGESGARCARKGVEKVS